MSIMISTQTAELIVQLLSRKTSETRLDPIASQLQDLFFVAESIASARIEGNHTTLADYVFRDKDSKNADDNIVQISNIYEGLHFVISNPTVPIDPGYIRELHKYVTRNLRDEGDHTPGDFRRCDVRIQGSSHVPVSSGDVPASVYELCKYIQEEVESAEYLVRLAVAHHRFTSIHPFENGNGRTARLLTFAMLLRAGLHHLNGWLLHPSAFFNGDRESYYTHLEMADKGDTEAWIQYVLRGILSTMDKVSVCSNMETLHKKVILPAMKRVVPDTIELRILQYGLYHPSGFRPADLRKAMPEMANYEVSRRLRALREKGLIAQSETNSREYHVALVFNRDLLRALLTELDRHDLLYKNVVH